MTPQHTVSCANVPPCLSHGHHACWIAGHVCRYACSNFHLEGLCGSLQYVPARDWKMSVYVLLKKSAADHVGVLASGKRALRTCV